MESDNLMVFLNEMREKCGYDEDTGGAGGDNVVHYLQ
jgi:hypothetical protein